MGMMDRRTDCFSISDGPTHLEALRWFALGSSASALKYTTRVSISTAPRLNPSDPEAVALGGSILAPSPEGAVTGAEMVCRAFDRAIAWNDACYSGRWEVAALDHSHIAGSRQAVMLPS